MDEEFEQHEKKKKKHPALKYIAYIVVVLIATGISLAVSLWGDKFWSVVNAFGNTDWIWAFAMVGLMGFSYIIEGLIFKIFCRLYTRRYRMHQGLATAMIGSFYNNVTPGASGGQIMQVYTMKQQGMQVSNSASIMVMWFILYQSILVLFDILTLIVEAPTIPNMRPLDFANNTINIPVIYIIIAGFVLNLSIIAMLYIMSFSHKIHNFVLHYIVGFLGKIHLIRNPEKTRENLRVQVENFKIELKRLQVNVPVVILVGILFLALLMVRFSIPYFAGLALHAYGDDYTINVKDLFDAIFLCSFHQMCAGLIPLPGQAGVSEYFFYYLYYSFFQSLAPANMDPLVIEANVNACQILWRTTTFHLVTLVGGIVSAFYRSRPKEEIHYANHQTFVDQIQARIRENLEKGGDPEDEEVHDLPRKVRKNIKQAEKKPKKRRGKDNDGWSNWTID